METLDFLELKDRIEKQLKEDFKLELLELHYAPYAFGSGMTAYRINGIIVKMIFEGRDNLLELMVSASHEKYIRANWTSIFTGTSIDFIHKGVTELKKMLTAIE